MFRKFTKLYMVFLLILIVIGGVGIFLSDKPDEDDLASLEEQAAKKTPGYATMTSLAQIAEKHLLEDSILDIQVSPNGNREDALLQLQTTEFLTEDTLLKNTFNMLQDVQKVDTLNTFTIAWFMQEESENVEVLTLTIDRKTLDQLHTVRYNDLPEIASSYEKHETLQ